MTCRIRLNMTPAGIIPLLLLFICAPRAVFPCQTSAIPRSTWRPYTKKKFSTAGLNLFAVGATTTMIYHTNPLWRRRNGISSAPGTPAMVPPRRGSSNTSFLTRGSRVKNVQQGGVDLTLMKMVINRHIKDAYRVQGGRTTPDSGFYTETTRRRRRRRRRRKRRSAAKGALIGIALIRLVKDKAEVLKLRY